MSAIRCRCAWRPWTWRRVLLTSSAHESTVWPRASWPNLRRALLLTRVSLLTGRSAVSLSSFGGEGQGEEAPYAIDPAIHGRHLYSDLQVAGRLPVRLLPQLLDRQRNERIVRHLSHHLQAARATLQCVPDLPQNTFSIAAPLMIPEAQFLNALGSQELFSRRVMFPLPGQPVFKSVQFHCPPCRGAIEVKKVCAERMLAGAGQTSWR